MKLWKRYKKLIFRNTSLNHYSEYKGLHYWNNKLFSYILIYSLPVCFIALIPGILMSVKGGIPMLGIFDFFAVVLLSMAAFLPGMKLSLRKALFGITFYLTSIILLAYLGTFGPGMVYLLAISVFFTLVFPRVWGYLSVALNFIICLAFSFAVEEGLLNFPASPFYSFNSLMTVSMNIVFLSAVSVILLNLLLKGLEGTIRKEHFLHNQLFKESMEQKKVLKDLKLKNQELEQFNFIASHNMQEPLSIISGYVDAFGELNTQDPTTQKLLENIKSSTSRMKSLICHLLSYSLLGKNKEMELINCNEVIEKVLRECKHEISATGAVFDIGKLPVIKGFNPEIFILFKNIICNALTYRKVEEPPLITIRSKKEENNWIFSIQDNGIGIEKKYHEKIFHLFQRLNHKQSYKGDGIGLAHCRKITLLHNGNIWLSSEPGIGSVFSISLPCSVEKEFSTNEQKTKMRSAY